MVFKSFDIADTILGEASKKFYPEWKISDEKFHRFKQNCSQFDELVAELDPETINVKIDEKTKMIYMNLEHSDVIIETKNNAFVSLLTECESFSVEHISEDLLKLNFILPGIWDKAATLD